VQAFAERRKGRMLLRGLRKRCANCGAGGLFERYFRMVERCPRCGYRFERQDGFALGAMAVNIVVAEGLFFVFLIGSLVATWPDPPVGLLVGAGIALNLVVPVVFYPWSKTVWAAVDLAMRPLDEADLADAAAHTLIRQAAPKASDGR
jgi:uncharacterized protein (DUF983 family)